MLRFYFNPDEAKTSRFARYRMSNKTTSQPQVFVEFSVDSTTECIYIYMYVCVYLYMNIYVY